VAIVVAVCNWLNAPSWITWGLPIVICGVTALGWTVRAVKAAGKRPGAT
jgi:hypothetical protein